MNADLLPLTPEVIEKTKTVVKETRPQVVTYMGRRARVSEKRHTTKASGLRTSTIEWIDDATEHNGGHAAGTVVTRILDGDPRSKWFVQYSEVVTRPETNLGTATGSIATMQVR